MLKLKRVFSFLSSNYQHATICVDSVGHEEQEAFFVGEPNAHKGSEMTIKI